MQGNDRASRTVVEQGNLGGFAEEAILKFFGVPYAAPPVGERRWRSPAAPPSWQGIRPVRHFSPACPQTVGASFNLRGSEQSEDCLYLNVWTQSCRPEAKRPVLVWFHGGGNRGGAGSEDAFDGTALAKQGATVVSFNYRLGGLDFWRTQPSARTLPCLIISRCCGGQDEHRRVRSRPKSGHNLRSIRRCGGHGQMPR